jgi:hypothetical protein
MSQKSAKKELEVFSNAKKLNEYILTATKNAPKTYRWNIVDLVIKASVNIITALYTANQEQNNEKRLALQRVIDVEIKVLSHLVETAHKFQVFKTKQRDHAASLILDTRRSLWAWINSNPAYEGSKKRK